MRLLYPGSPLRAREPDGRFAAEVAAVHAAGFAASLFSLKNFQNADFRASPPIPHGASVLYRGWMLSAVEYDALITEVTRCGANPMVVGPRFNPPGSTEGVDAASRSDTGASGQKTEVQYLKPGERSGHDIALKVDVDAGVAIEEFRCATHEVTCESASSNQLTVALKPEDRLPNRDLVLRYRVAGEKIKSELLTQRDERGGYFTLMLFPTRGVGGLARQPFGIGFRSGLFRQHERPADRAGEGRHRTRPAPAAPG